MLYIFIMYKLRATKKREEVRAVKSEPNAVRHFKVGPVLKIDATFHSRLNLCVKEKDI